ncbi:indolepyruvate oxidoreductase subunit beta family protein [Lentibacter sp. XHP0401]|uniref:indolepyruvate oxidoreductase subunit beta family protein n=1 Tax=Lentibacter sp. XHP0401 TaxID=2984334 RepID=UPI0021E85344|nr:indolepyruvate oxidoreductase subunit beta family protein [Lentibacter sp. XHP0401]MCV2893149.1 indolepyruvate oxidoreductase subunit beta family protein [Lentibacter sp. XHP0401]
MNALLPDRGPDAQTAAILKLAIMAVGGQGGGVLTSWIEALARSQGYACQATSVAGVAQRTGSTVYYVEMTPVSEQQPVFALAPSGGDVDVLIASEMMEVGRSIMRGFVTPDRTTLIGSTHRSLAYSEKAAPGNGMADSDEVRAGAEIAAQRLILADMDRLATEQGSVISSSLFGALAGSGALPFERAAFEDAIRASGKGVEASLRAFNAGFEAATQGAAVPVVTDKAPEPRQIVGPEKQLDAWHNLVARLLELPAEVREIAEAGLAKTVDYQDCIYGAAYLDHLDKIVARDSAAQGWMLSQTAAKYIANAMCYDDIIRVADLKTRAPRMMRIRREMGVRDENVMQLTEYFHPRAEEITGMLPAKMGARLEANPKAMERLTRWFGKGRRLRTDTLRAFAMLHVLGGMKSYRLKTHRHAVELQHLEKWLSASLASLDTDYGLCIELLKNRRLIKGYSDTHTRGLGKFDKLMKSAELLQGREDAAEWMARLREAALQDPEGKALDGAIETIKSFA